MTIAQSYVFCPKIDILNKFNTEGLAYVVFKDDRIFEKKLKEKCSSKELTQYFANYIQESFPKLNIIFLRDSQFDEESIENSITYKIEIKRYDATFYTGMYVSYSKFLVEIHNNRNGHKIYKYECNGKGSQFNALGYKSGKIASNSSFSHAFIEFVTIFEDGVKGNLISPSSITQTKAERLRELKKLLDEGNLSQEEFDVEKRKILND